MQCLHIHNKTFITKDGLKIKINNLHLHRALSNEKVYLLLHRTIKATMLHIDSMICVIIHSHAAISLGSSFMTKSKSIRFIIWKEIIFDKSSEYNHIQVGLFVKKAAGTAFKEI